MHATKAYATDEGGLVYSARTEEPVDDVRDDEQLRVRDARQATMPGLQREVERGRGPARAGEAHRAGPRWSGTRVDLHAAYRDTLPQLRFQQSRGTRQAHQVGYRRA